MFYRDARIAYIGVALASGVVWLTLVNLYGKYTAVLCGLNVIVWVIVVGFLLMALLSRTEWYITGRGSSQTMLRIALGGFILIALIGILATEPPLRTLRNPAPTPTLTTTGTSIVAPVVKDTTFRAGVQLLLGDLDFGGDDECAIAMLALAVVVLIVMAVTVPNFWVVGCGAMVSVLTLIAWRELTLAQRFPATKPAAVELPPVEEPRADPMTSDSADPG